MGASSSKKLNFKLGPKPTAVEPTNMICEMETFTTVFRAKIDYYSQLKLSPRHFSVNCGTFGLAGHQWAVFYEPNGCIYVDGYPKEYRVPSFRVQLLTHTNTSMYQTVGLRLVGPGGTSRKIAERSNAYKKRYDENAIKLGGRNRVRLSDYIIDDCLSFELTVSVAKWSHAQVVEKKPQASKR